jgi:hypothetical protein
VAPIPHEYVEAVDAERAELWRLVERAQQLAVEGDKPGLRALADEVRQRIEAGNGTWRTGGHLSGSIGDITAALDGVYDEVFPVRDPGDPADVSYAAPELPTGSTSPAAASTSSPVATCASCQHPSAPHRTGSCFCRSPTRTP